MSRTREHRLVVERWHPQKLNQLLGCHWGTRSRRKRFDAELVAIEAHNQDVPRATLRRRVSLLIVLGPRQRAGDVDAYQKSCLDALVCAGLLIDDSPAWCEIAPVVYERGPEKKTVIVLEDMEG